MFVSIGAILGGLFLLLRDLLPYMAAQRTGVIRTLGHSRKPVLRTEEPGRFDALCRNRADGAITGAMVIAVGLVWAFIGLLALILILPFWAIMAARAKRSKKSAAKVSEEFS